ncbi:hypothetical protein EDD21DRAFT_373472 [Dissophora ornata]|nr:hypothetical protein EDD21DRAFT_373472 [Dissophora ornata]
MDPSRSTTVIPSPFLKVFLLPELADSILRYLPLPDVCVLRSTCHQLLEVCSSSRWFYKDVSVPVNVYHFGKKDNEQDHLPWDATTMAQYVRSLSAQLYKQSALELVDEAISKYPNLTGIAFDSLKVMVNNRHSPEEVASSAFSITASASQIERMWQQVLMVGPRLKRLSITIALLLWSEINDSEQEAINVPRVMKDGACLLLERFQAQSHGFRFLCLECLRLDVSTDHGVLSRKRRSLDWSSVADFLRCTPSLRELSLGSIELLDPATSGVSCNSKNNSHQSLRLTSLRKLTITVSMDIEVAFKITQAFPNLRELDILDIGDFCIKPETLATTLGHVMNSNTPWVPFPYLERFRASRTLKEYPLTGLIWMKLPPSVIELELRQSGVRFDGDLSKIIDPATTLQLLKFHPDEIEPFQDLQHQSWCHHLTALSVHDGLFLLRDLLTEGSPPECLATATDRIDVQTSPTERSWDSDHLTEEFVLSRIPFAGFLKSLDVGGSHGSGSTHLMDRFLNRLLRCLPRLQDFAMAHCLQTLDFLLDGLGRQPQPISGNKSGNGCREDALEEGAVATGSGDGDGGVEFNEDWSMERPLLRTVRLHISNDIYKAEDILRSHFRFLDTIDLTIHGDSDSEEYCCEFGLFD